MSFEKRVCVLKQVKKGFTADGSALSGAVYAERMGEELTVMPRLLGIAPVKEGRYVLALWIEGQVFLAELTDRSAFRMRTPSIKGGFAVLLAYVRTEAEPVAFGCCGVAPNTYEGLLCAIKGEKNKAPMPTKDEAPMSEKDGEDTDMLPFRDAEKYNDEAIASENYYGSESADDGDDAAADAGEETINPISVGQEGEAYYACVREKLELAFRKYPKDTRLLSAFPNSAWVRAENALLGILYREGRPAYLCVAVEAKGDPPAEMREHCMFVPASPFVREEEEGFYVVFQSAATGEYVTVELS